MNSSAYHQRPLDPGMRLFVAALISFMLHLWIILGIQVGAVERGGVPPRVLEARLAPWPAASENTVLLKAIDRPVKSQVRDYVPPPQAVTSAEPGVAPSPEAAAPKAGLPAAAASPTLLDAPLPPDTTYYTAKEVDVRPKSLGDPAYPEQAAQLNIGGRVRVKFLLNENGGVDEATILSVDPPDWGFDTAVLDYLKTARFKPALRKGRAVRSMVMYELEFSVTETGGK